MSQLHNLISKAGKSSLNKWILNTVMSRAVPFNAPHHFKILEISPGETTVCLPYRKSNLNHVKGIHACALATLCEYTIGLSVVSMISEKAYRIILKSIKVDFHYQAKMNVVATFSINEEFVRKNISEPLQTNEAVFLDFEIKVHDTEGNHICTGFANWQVKKWEKVKSK